MITNISFQHIRTEGGTKCIILNILIQPAYPELVEKCEAVLSGAKSLLEMRPYSDVRV